MQNEVISRSRYDMSLTFQHVGARGVAERHEAGAAHRRRIDAPARVPVEPCAPPVRGNVKQLRLADGETACRLANVHLERSGRRGGS